jgi:CotH kinase protein/Bacterial Ig-like domain (group 3)/Bacterial Ig domain
MATRRLGSIGFALLFVMSSASAWAQTFTISASPTAITIHPGDQNVPVTVSVGSSSYTGPISVSLTNLPSGISVSPLTLTAGSSGTMTLSAAPDADQEAFPAASASDANTKTNTVTVVGAAGTAQATSMLALTVSLTNPSFAPSQLNLPIVRIDTGGTPIVDKTTDVPGTITITSSDGSVTYLPSSTNTDDTATFHLHGNSTISMPKKPYHVKLTTSLDLLNAMGLSCPYVTGKGAPVCDKSKSYILLANYDDKTLLRDWAASALAIAIPIGGTSLSEQATAGTTPPSPSGTSTVMPWAPHSLFIELYLNGAYEGNYQLIEEVKVDSHRVNITELSETDTTDDITGGYLMEIDNRADEAFTWKTPKGVPIGLIDPDFTPDPEVPEQTSYIESYVNKAETALFSSTFTDPTTGWRNYFDEASAVNFYIVNDVMGNVDGGDFFSSDYLYKAIDNQYLYMGPIWDFDISSGNVNYEPIYNPTVPWMQTSATWYRQWFKDPGFKADVITQWNTLQADQVFTNWIASIQGKAAALEQSQANNFGRWPMLGERVWPNSEASSTYDAEVAYLTNWLTLRIAYLDSQFNGKAKTATTLKAQSGTLRSGTPVQLIAATAGSGTPSGTVSFMSNGIVVGTASLTGGMASGNFNLPAGTDALTAVYSGDGTNALSASTAQTVTVLGPLARSTTSLSASTSSPSQGASVGFPISVLGNSGTAAATGSVALTVNGSSLGSVSLSGGKATFTTAALPVGTNLIQANYSGDTNYSASSSPTVTVTVSQSSGCTAPASPGVVICSPVNNSTVGTTVQAEAAATITGTLARMEVWVDGVKKYTETSGKLLNTTITLASGTHLFSFYAVNTAGRKWNATVHSTVSSGLITPTITWANPASIAYGTTLSGAQLNAIANVAGSFVYSPAAGTLLGVGTHSLSTTFTPTDTAHYTTAAKAVSITVTNAAGSCSAPTSAGVSVCFPINGSTVSSPVQVQAASTITGALDRMELWVDGVKKYTETSSKTLTTSISLGAGGHRFGIFAVNTAGTKWEGVVNATVR